MQFPGEKLANSDYCLIFRRYTNLQERELPPLPPADAGHPVAGHNPLQLQPDALPSGQHQTDRLRGFTGKLRGNIVAGKPVRKYWQNQCTFIRNYLTFATLPANLSV